MCIRVIGGLVLIGLAFAGASNCYAQAPVISAAPLSKLVVAGQPVTFAVTASGATPLTYQWSRHGQAIAGATGATFSIPSAARSDSGWYQVTATGPAGTVKSVFALDVAIAGGAVVGWGDGYTNQSVIPPGLGAVAAVAAGQQTVVLRTDGNVGAWSAGSGSAQLVVVAE